MSSLTSLFNETPSVIVIPCGRHSASTAVQKEQGSNSNPQELTHCYDSSIL